MIKSFVDEFHRYRIIGQKALDQVPDDALNQVSGTDCNSVAMLVRHISGNLISRFTDFLTSDGEKPWRNRDAEFEELTCSREEVEHLWAKGWEVLESQLSQLSDADIERQVTIRGQTLTVHEALARSTAHMSYHVGQLVMLARMLTRDPWKWISIPKGTSGGHNQNPTTEKTPE